MKGFNDSPKITRFADRLEMTRTSDIETGAVVRAQSFRQHSLRRMMSRSKRHFHDDKVSGNKIKILALHGKGSNKEVTTAQLKNLDITDDKYDITCLNGPLLDDEENSELLKMFNGPFYSWYYSNYNDTRFKPSFLAAIAYVYQKIQKHGPFDVLYGFSQGATLATYVTLAYENASLQRQVIAVDTTISSFDQVEDTAFSQSRRSLLNRTSSGLSDFIKKAYHPGTSDERSSKMIERRSSFRMRQNLASDQETSTTSIFTKPPAQYILLACCVDDSATILNILHLNHDVRTSIPSMHLIGTNDPRRNKSEDITSLYADVQVRYMPGGHLIARHVSSDINLISTIDVCLHELENSEKLIEPEMKKVSDISSMGMMKTIQFAQVELEASKFKYSLQEVLSEKNSAKPMLYNARDTDINRFTSYGDALKFIHGGAGDLRRLGVKPGEVVSYGTLPGGGKSIAV